MQAQNESSHSKIKNLQNIKAIQAFNRNLEKGDLGLSSLIPYGYSLYGDTRAGKTALAHILSGNSLKGVKIKGQLMVQPTTSRNKKAKIGNTMNSETLVPNTLKPQGRSDQYAIIDTPGYGDTNGILTILANGYYHYRLYSKVQNMKIILCFDANQLQNTAITFFNTIVQWTHSFKDYLQIRKQIWKSVAFVFTKVQDQPTIKEDLITKLRTIVHDMRTQYEQDVKNALKQLIQFIINNDRLFYVKKIKEGETLVAGNLLNQIDKKVSKWWTRQYDPERKQFDMSPVSFAVSKQIIKSITQYPVNRRQFIDLITYYNLRIKEFVQMVSETTEAKGFSLAFVIHKLVDDAMGHPDSHQFLEVMKGYIDLYYKNYDDSYNEERQRAEEHLFSIKNEGTLTKNSRQKFRGKDKNYLVKKFKCLKQIEKLKNQINDLGQKDKDDINAIEFCAQKIYQIIKQFNFIAFNRRNASEIIHKFGYIIHRIIEETKIFILLIEVYGAKDKKAIRDQVDGKYIELFGEIRHFMGVPFKYNKKQVSYENLHLGFIKKFDINDEIYRQLQINQSLVNFFTLIDIQDEEDVQKQFQVVLTYSDSVIQETQKLSTITFDKGKAKIIERLSFIRISCQQAYHNLLHNQRETDNCMFTIRKATKKLGRLLQLIGEYQLSRKVYSTIKFVDSVCKLYRKQIQMLKQSNLNKGDSRRKLFVLKIDFSKYLAQHLRQNEAIEVLQECFELAEDKDEVLQVKEQLGGLRLRMKDTAFVTNYQIQLDNREFFEDFKQDLCEELKNLQKKAI